MFVEEIPNFLDTITGSIFLVGAITLTCVIGGVLAGYLVATFRHGPFEAFYVVSSVIAQAIPDFLRTSPRRVYAIARLAAKEAIRRRVILVTFLIFALALLFGGWFINSGVSNPEQVYVNFVLFGTQLLILMLALLISAFSLPEDIKNKTIFTIVTKPVRSTEVILGRIMGFGALCTVLLFTMALISLLFVWRGLSHQHEMVSNNDNPEAVVGSISSFNDVVTPGKAKTGRRVSANCIKELMTGLENGHRHQLEYIREVRSPDDVPPNEDSVVKKETLPDGDIVYFRVVCQPAAGHTHAVKIEQRDGESIVKLGPARGYFRARVPIYCQKVNYYSREGILKGVVERSGERKTAEGKKTKETVGINVGKQNNYRGFLDGSTALSRAEFEFQDFSDARFGGDSQKIPLELSLGVFRTHKGKIDRRIRASIQFESVQSDPNDASESFFISDPPLVFETMEYELQTLTISRKLRGRHIDANGVEISSGEFDLFDDFGANGKLKVIVRCEDAGQYIGVGLGDVYFRAEDNVYWLNFFKGYVGIWFQMMIVVTLGVVFSTFLSTPVTMLGTSCVVVLGFLSKFIRNMRAPESAGGGPIESMVRLVTQQNMVEEMEQSFATTLMKQADVVFVYCLNSLTYVAPNFGKLDFSSFLKYGYWIETDRLMVAGAASLALCFGLFVFGYFCLKTREIAG